MRPGSHVLILEIEHGPASVESCITLVLLRRNYFDLSLSDERLPPRVPGKLSLLQPK